MNACFIGHRTIQKTEALVSSLKETVIKLINMGVTTFLFGNNSEFDSLQLEVVSELKKIYPVVKRVYVRSAFQHINKTYQEYLLKSYEETYFPTKIANAGKYSYVERNCEMIDNSTYCVFYYNKDYIPPIRRRFINRAFPSSCNSGTKIAYEYATKKKKEVINLYMQIEFHSKHLKTFCFPSAKACKYRIMVCIKKNQAPI